MEDSELKEPLQLEQRPWHMANLAKRNRFAWNNAYMTDCTLIVGEEKKEFQCHKYYLCLASSVLDETLLKDSEENQKIFLPHISSLNFHAVLEYIYTDYIKKKNLVTIQSAWIAARELGIISLEQYCVTCARQRLCVSNACSTLQFARLINDEEFEQFCTQERQTMGSVVQSVFENKDELTDLVPLIDEQDENFKEENSTRTAQDTKICINDDVETSRFEQAIKNEQQQWNEGVEKRVVDGLQLMAACTSSKQVVIPSEDVETKSNLARDVDVVPGHENEGESKLKVEMIAGEEEIRQKILMNEEVQESKVESNLEEVSITVEDEKDQEMIQISMDGFGQEKEGTFENDARKIKTENKKETFNFESDVDRDGEYIDVGQENKEASNESTFDDTNAQEITISVYNEVISEGFFQENSEHDPNMITTENKSETFNFEVIAVDTASEDVGQESTEEQETGIFTDEKEQEIEDVGADENWEDLESCSDSDAEQETLNYMKMMLAPKLPQRHESGGKEQSWREGTMIQRNLYALVTGYNSDCSFHIHSGDELWVFPCHALPLSWASSQLEKMLEETNTHELLDVEPRHFLKLLEFIYTDATMLDDIDSALGVWSVAHELDVKSLASHCASRVRELVTFEVVCQALEFARHSGDTETEQFCIKFIREHTSAVLAADNWSKITRETLETILSQDELNCASELELFQACVRWVTASSGDRNARDALGSVLGFIRFRTFSARDFAISVCPTKLLTDGEQSDIFCCLATNSAKMPTGFSSNTKPRDSCAVIKSSVSVAIGTSDFDETYSRPDSTLSTEYSPQLEPSSNSNTENSQLGVASWLNAEFNQQRDSTSNVSYAESLRKSLVDSCAGDESDCNDNKNKVKMVPQPAVQGKFEDLKKNCYIGKTQVITLVYTGEPVFIHNGHFILSKPISFSVNISTYITSVDLISWHNDDKKVVRQARYREYVLVMLKAPNGNILAQGKYEQKASHQKAYKVKFFRPFCLTPNVTYKLYLQFDDLDIFHCGYPIAKNRVYWTSWGLQVKILDASSSQLRAIEFAERIL